MNDLQLLVGYADRGWKIMPVHGVNADGVCKCSKGHDCPSPGKHPIHRDWAGAASCDAETIAEWYEKYLGCNWGLKLGPDSGVVDVEYDTPEGEQTAREIFGEFYTPVCKSNRSQHYFVKWSESFPDKQKLEIRGLEIRIGGGKKSTQSVIAPSLHKSGVRYAWLDGLSPSDVEVADPPEALMALIYNQAVEADHEVKPQFPPSRARQIHDVEKVNEGERNSKLYLFACREARRSRDLDDPQEQGDLLDKILGMNLVHCNPPLDRVEIETLYRSAITYAKQQTQQENRDTARKYTIHGLTYDDGEWGPGDWRLTVINGDPVSYVLHVPAWRSLTADGTGNIAVTLDEFRDAGKLARAIQAATRKIVLDDRPQQWPNIWNGQRRRGQLATRGVKAQLLDNPDEIDPPPTAKRFVMVGEYLLEKIANAKKAEDPDKSGYAVQRPDGTIWFSWKKIWTDGEMTGQIARDEAEKLRARMGLEAKDFRYWPHRGEHRKRYCVLTPGAVKNLKRLVEQGDGDDRG